MDDKIKRPGIRRMLQMKASIQKIPISGAFELTPLCNMNCKMCYVREDRSVLDRTEKLPDKQWWIEMGKKCREQGTLFLLLTGGEIFSYPDFKEIYIELIKMGFIISLNTNATLIDEKTVGWLKMYRPSRINVTVYGACNDTYKRLCGNDRGFSQVDNAINLLINEGFNVHINISVTKENKGDIEEICKYALDKGLAYTVAPYMYPAIRKDNYDYDRIKPEEAGAIYYMTQKLCATDEFLKNENSRGGEEEDECTRTKDEHMGCMAGRSSFWITWQGILTPCGMMTKPAVDLWHTEFDRGFSIIVDEVSKILLPHTCSNCKKRGRCMVCGAVAQAENPDDVRKKPEYMCRMVQEYDRHFDL